MSAAGEDLQTEQEIPEVTFEELRALLRDPKVRVLNVLPREAYVAGHVPGSLSLPVADIAQRASELLPDRDQPIVVYCASLTCPADRRAFAALRGMGYRNVRIFPPGFAGWVEAGGRVERGEGAAPAAVSRAIPLAPVVPAVPIPARAAVDRGAGFRDRLLESFERVIRLPASALLGLWLSIIVVFGFVYWLPTLAGVVTLLSAGEPVPATPEGLATALYFSFVTGLSVGYGDVVPVGWLRLPAILEGAADLLLFGFVVSKFMTGRQDLLLEELHRTTFEERLGRVRTNLHFVLLEFEDIGDACRGKDQPTTRIQARIESAVLIFTGELRTIHDLLYRPEQRPEEAVLEGLLASLAANLESLRSLLSCLPGDRDDLPVLVTQLAAITGLSEEICGECVPHEFAPHLRVWMDRVQERARALSSVAP